MQVGVKKYTNEHPHLPVQSVYPFSAIPSQREFRGHILICDSNVDWLVSSVHILDPSLSRYTPVTPWHWGYPQSPAFNFL